MKTKYGKLVCWSGGCDSTLVLHELAKNSTPGRPIRTVSFTTNQTPAGAQQIAARRNLLKWFKSKSMHIEPLEIKIETTGEGFIANGLPQAVIWLYASQCLEKQEHLYSGYIRGDDFWMMSETLKTAFKAVQKTSNRTGKWRFPLKFTYKTEVISRLKAIGIYDLTWWCESDFVKAQVSSLGETFIPCGECHSCQVHEAALWQLNKPSKYHDDNSMRRRTQNA